MGSESSDNVNEYLSVLFFNIHKRDKFSCMIQKNVSNDGHSLKCLDI